MFSTFLSEGRKVSFDLDDTLQFNGEDEVIPRDKYINAFKKHINDGDTVIIVTSRHETMADRKDVKSFLQRNSLPDVDVFYTNGNLKADTLKKQNVDIHYDDDKRENDAANKLNIKAISSFDDELVKLYSTNFDANVEYDM